METLLYFDKTNSSPICRISSMKLGSMRNVWSDGKNPAREQYVKKIYPDKKIVNIELCHSQKIEIVKTESDIAELEKNKVCCDGIITDNPDFVPAVTVADCMPVFVYAKIETKKQNEPLNKMIFGALHSGWKGTGICIKAVEILQNEFNAEKQNIYFLLGPHIRECCYNVDKDRAEYFQKNFTPDCVHQIDSERFSLSLEKANVYALKKIGIPAKNILTTGECTCCTKTGSNGSKDSEFKYGSFRREKYMEKKPLFTAMLASISL